MTESIYEKVCNEALIATLTEVVSEVVDKKLENLRDEMSSPYVNGLNGLAKYLGIGESLATKLYKTKKIKSSRYGREIWFKKSNIEQFMTNHKE